MIQDSNKQTSSNHNSSNHISIPLNDAIISSVVLQDNNIISV
jgi:hypothetical protein